VVAIPASCSSSDIRAQLGSPRLHKLPRFSAFSEMPGSGLGREKCDDTAKGNGIVLLHVPPDGRSSPFPQPVPPRYPESTPLQPILLGTQCSGGPRDASPRHSHCTLLSLHTTVLVIHRYYSPHSTLNTILNVTLSYTLCPRDPRRILHSTSPFLADQTQHLGTRRSINCTPAMLTPPRIYHPDKRRRKWADPSTVSRL